LSNRDLKSKTFTVPASGLRLEKKVKNSRFIASIAFSENVEDAWKYINGVRKEFPDASHNVPVFIIGGGNTRTEYCSDDGEPTGTAGKPALAVLRGSGLGDVVLVITRYFGGTLLGKGGLIKAYTESAQLVASAVPRAEKKQVHEVRISLPYNLFEPIRILCKETNGTIINEVFLENIQLMLYIPVDRISSFQDGVRELSGGKIITEIISTSNILFRVYGK
jgi:uncharacterized YigZ family protein